MRLVFLNHLDVHCDEMGIFENLLDSAQSHLLLLYHSLDLWQVLRDDLCVDYLRVAIGYFVTMKLAER